MSDIFEADVIIVGGGPAGCACALYTARSSLKTYILDKNPAVGALAITHKIANYPGVPADTSGADLLKTMRDQAISYGADYQQVQVGWMYMQLLLVVTTTYMQLTIGVLVMKYRVMFSVTMVMLPYLLQHKDHLLLQVQQNQHVV